MPLQKMHHYIKILLQADTVVCGVRSHTKKLQLARDARGAFRKRSLDTLDNDFQRFTTTGRGNIKVAKTVQQYNQGEAI